MRVIITGATGMIGKGVLYECLESNKVSDVLSISRRALQIKHPKLKELIIENFSSLPSKTHELENYDSCFHCMGVSAAGLSEQEYAHITYEHSLTLMNTLYTISPQMVVTYVSGVGTDSSERGRIMWARVKGKTENAILNMGFKDAYMYRPGMIIPLKGIKSSTKLYQFMYDYFMWLVKLIKWISPKSVVSTTDIGQSMIRVSLSPYQNKILLPPDILSTSH